MKRQPLEGGELPPAVYGPAGVFWRQPATKAVNLIPSGSQVSLGLKEGSAGAPGSDDLGSNPIPSCVSVDKFLHLSEPQFPLQ